ncbi:MAG: hypothetical protein OEW39_09655 [Deltaproteobacteria bacterium]|nr:hypothetical protein [Deltaproteobacteria bacterium]
MNTAPLGRLEDQLRWGFIDVFGEFRITWFEYSRASNPLVGPLTVSQRPIAHATVQSRIPGFRLLALGVLTALVAQQSALYLLCHLLVTGAHPPQPPLLNLEDGALALEAPFACEAPFAAGRGALPGGAGVLAHTEPVPPANSPDSQGALPCPVCLQVLPEQPWPLATLSPRFAPKDWLPANPGVERPLTVHRSLFLSPRGPPQSV